jgi:hypothetical protein
MLVGLGAMDTNCVRPAHTQRRAMHIEEQWYTGINEARFYAH